MRIREVVLHDPSSSVVRGLLDDLVEIARQVNALSLRHVVRFDDVRLPLLHCTTVFVNKVVPEFACLHRQDPRPREELEQLRKLFLHFAKVAGHSVFASDYLNSRELVHFLVRL